MPKNKTIKTLLTAAQIKYALSISPQYKGDIDEKEFIITRKFVLRHWLYPIIKGEIIKQKDCTQVKISFGMQRREKRANMLFCILPVLMSLATLILSKDVSLMAVILAFGAFCFLIGWVIYKIRCYSDFVKISEILKKE